MLSEKDRSDIVAAVTALKDADPWAALAPLSQLAGSGTQVQIDMSTMDAIGAPVIFAAPVRSDPFAPLTARQREVAQWAANGASNKAIARALHLSPATVKDHIHACLNRLGLRSRTELAALLHGRYPRTPN